MKFKFLAILIFSSVTVGNAAERNLCDDLIDSGTSTPEQIKKCLDDPRFGPSTHYKNEEAKNKNKIETIKIIENTNVKNQKNLEIKVFHSDELFSEGFGKPFYAIRGDYRNHRYKEKRITGGDALCSYLGYEKVIKSIVSAEIWENKNGNMKVDKQGLVVESSAPEIYRDADYKFTVRKYLEITCVRRKDKSLNEANDGLKAVTEDLLMLNEELNLPTNNQSNSNINNDSRTTPSKTGKTPNGYIPPEWANDSGAIKK